MEDTLVLLVGASGSGKTSVAKELEKIGYNVIQSYTTRKPRYEGEWGHTFIGKYIPDVIKDCRGHISLIRWNEYLLPKTVFGDNIIAFFNDYKNNEIYFATKEQYKNKGTSIYIVDPEGANQVRENVKDAKIITIFLAVDENMRYNRLIEDNRGLITGVSDRIEKDRRIFSKCKCDYVVDGNQSLEGVVNMVRSIIEQEVL